jgi:hypothetical protein
MSIGLSRERPEVRLNDRVRYVGQLSNVRADTGAGVTCRFPGSHSGRPENRGA